MKFLLISLMFMLSFQLAIQEIDNKKSTESMYQNSIIQTFFRRTKLIPQVNSNDNLCPPTQSKTFCLGQQPCCGYNGRFGCCPYSYGKCCGDGYCVPQSGVC